jgi:PAS domain S-box-containing protein
MDVEVTQRKHAEETSARVAAMVESSLDVIIGMDLEGRITSWNSTAEKLFGYATTQIVGRPIATLVPPEREKELTAQCERALRGEGAFAWATERLHSAGTSAPVSVALSVFRDASGDAVGLVAVLRDLSERRRYDRESRIAQVLQESLVPSELPEVPGLRFACRYLPAAHVGGDWYDVVPLSDVRIGVAIGDVVGRGVRAASAMGQLRSGLRIYALEGFSPGMLLERLNQLLHRLGEGDFSTLLYLTLDPQTGVVAFASAGHVPPLLVPPAGSASYLQGGTSLPLGTDPEALYPEGGIVLEPGSTLLLYTDGLVESRRRDVEEGMGVLLAEATRGPRDLEALLDDLVERVPDDDPDDDLALFALRMAAGVEASG